MNTSESTEKCGGLTALQEKALHAMLQGKNVFLTGPSGTGKSLVLEKYKELVAGRRKVAVTSTTGISALLVGGTTIHSFLCIGLGEGTPEYLAKKILDMSYAKNRWTKLEVLIIDEISMLSPELFDKLEKVARIVRSPTPRGLLNKVPDLPSSKEEAKNVSSTPFGGIQLILSGDFLQLPVVGSDKFCFESESWNMCVDTTISLTEIMRQDDRDFQAVLNEVRFGLVSGKGKAMLDARIGVELKNEYGIKPTRIYTTNASVDTINNRELDLLKQIEGNTSYQYDMEVSFGEEVKNRTTMLERIRKNCLAPSVLELCVDAQVMLLCNLDLEAGLANGSRGVVVSFLEDFPVIRFMNGEERVIDSHSWDIMDGDKKQAQVTQLPLKLAWCITTHKSQGATLDCAEVDLSNIFAYGQAYVALSRVKRLEGLAIKDIDYAGIKASPRAVSFYRKMEGS